MNRTNSLPESLQQFVSVQLNCMEAQLDSKETVKRELLNYIAENYIALGDVHSINDFPVVWLEMLHRDFGLCFDVDGGKVTRIFIEPELALETATPEVANVC